MKAIQPDLPTPPATLDYQLVGGGDFWRVEKFRELGAEFPLLARDYAGQMALLHQLGLQLPRPWEFVRRLFGVNPVILPENSDPDEYRRLTRKELCEAKGITKEELRADLDQLRALWAQFNARNDPEKSNVQGATSSVEAAPVNESAQEEEARVIREAGFDVAMFDRVMVFDPKQDKDENPTQTVERPPEKNAQERSWFAQRCRESKAMLAVPMARMQVRDMLQNELTLSRMQDRLALLPDGSPEAEKLDRRKGELQERYEKQMDKLQEMFPELHVASRVSFRQTIAMLFAGEQDFYGDENNQRRTVLFTAAELQVLSRQSVQLPQPQYLLSLEFLAMEAIHGLYDRRFQSKLAKRPSVLKTINAIGKAAIEAARVASGTPLTDLEAGVIPGAPGTEEFEEVIIFEKS